MGYMHIDNLYKNTDILQFKKVYALEKIHGTSAHIKWLVTREDAADGIHGGSTHWGLTFFSGGEKHDNFVKLFNELELRAKFHELGLDSVTIYGEAYGGKQQGMKDTYGPNLRFVAFDVLIGENWLSVPQAESLCKNLGIEFVDYALVDATVEELNLQRDRESIQAVRNGMGPGKLREGVVVRPPFEVKTNNGKRLIAKHKRDEFRETKTPRPVDPEKLKILEDAKEIASEWVTEMRLSHVMDKLTPPATEPQDTPRVIKAMLEDISREGCGEIGWTPEATKTIGNTTAVMFKKRISKI